MRNYCTFMQKELMENLRTKNVLVLACVFAFFAILSPLMARYIVEIIGFFAGGDDMAQTIIGIHEPTYLDSFSGFFSDLGLTGCITVILVYMSSVLREKRTGTADIMLTKGLKMREFVFAKFTVAAGIIIVIVFLSVLVAYVYTLLLFDEAGQIGNTILAGFAFTVFLLMFLAITLMFSSFAKGTGSSAVFSLLAYFLISLTTIFARVGQYSPASLITTPIQISRGVTPDGVLGSIIVSAVVTVLALWAAIKLTAKRQIV